MPSCAFIYLSCLTHLSYYAHTPVFVFYFCCDSSVQLLSHIQIFVTPWTTACQASLSITNSHLLKFMSVKSVMPSIQPSHPLSSPSPPDFDLSQYQGLFQWVSSLHQVAKVLEFQLQHQSFQWIFPGKGNAKPLQYSALRTPWTVWNKLGLD